MSVLIVTASSSDSDPKPNSFAHFLPVSRLQTYIEIINSSGLKFSVSPIDQLANCQLSDFQAIIVTCSFRYFNKNNISLLKTASQEQRIPIITDSFLIKDKVFSLFGITDCSGVISTTDIISDGGVHLYSPQPYPYSEQGKALGIRPVLRFLLQNWFARKISWSKTARIKASFTGKSPAIIAHNAGKATNLLLNFHPSLVFKEAGVIHAYFRRLVEAASPLSIAFDLSKITCLRMDDPGSSERVYLENFNPGVISDTEWQTILGLLKQQQAHLNVAYVPQWIDDGESSNSELYYQGKAIHDRKPGRLYNSWEVCYQKKCYHGTHDYAAEYSMIKQGVDNGLITILSHGLTHLTTHTDLWLKAKDRYTNMEWYREFREMVTGKQRSAEYLSRRMKTSRQLLKSAFGREPEVLVPSAHEQTAAIPAIAMHAGFTSCSSRALFTQQESIINNRKIKAFYPNEIAAIHAYFLAEYPIIFCFHDYDIYRYGSDWLREKLALFKSWGDIQFISLELLTALLTASVDFTEAKQSLVVIIRFPFALSQESAIPLRINRKVSPLLVINGKTSSVKIAFRDNCSFLSIPGAFIDSDNQLEISLTTVEVGPALG